MSKSIIRIKFIYQSPYTDEPNKKFISKIYDLKELLFDSNPQIDFTDGSYLMLKEMEEQYTTIMVLL
jgi:hypothetical protein